MSILLCLAGILISGYLSWAHYAPNASLACAESGAINCEAVTTSPWSMMGPFPVALLGLFWFAIMLCLEVTLPQQGRGSPPPVQLFLSTLGLIFVFYLIFTELFLINAICLWCTAVHLLVIVLFLATLNAYLRAQE